MGSQSANENASGAKADHGVTSREECGKVRHRLAIIHVTACNAIRRVNLSAERILEFARQWQGGRAEYEEDGLHHASVPE